MKKTYIEFLIVVGFMVAFNYLVGCMESTRTPSFTEFTYEDSLTEQNAENAVYMAYRLSEIYSYHEAYSIAVDFWKERKIGSKTKNHRWQSREGLIAAFSANRKWRLHYKRTTEWQFQSPYAKLAAMEIAIGKAERRCTPIEGFKDLLDRECSLLGKPVLSVNKR